MGNCIYARYELELALMKERHKNLKSSLSTTKKILNLNAGQLRWNKTYFFPMPVAIFQN